MKLLSYNTILLILTVSLVWLSLKNIKLDGQTPITESHIFPFINQLRPDQPTSSTLPLPS
jgi:hypothetical protein